ncbi:MAG: carbohydrate ABC transporter substrate-binding protein [Clostridia bacterium]|nr:carbohydrate ABC transporter substrate-binding protein [Clostridia bacterium]
MKKLLSVLLAMLMLAAAVACAKTPNGPSTADTTVPGDASPSSGSDAETTAATHDEDGFLLDSIPSHLRWEGETVDVLHWDTQQPEFAVEAATGEVVNDAIFKRNQTVEDRFGITLTFREEKGSVSDQKNFVNVVERTVSAGELVYDIIAAYSRVSGTLAQSGYLYDLNDVYYLDFTKPWWPETMLETSTIGDKLYFVSGDMSTNLIYMLYGIYYQKDMLIDEGLEDPQQLVLDHKWTLDKMIEMTTDIYRDLDGNGTKTFYDRFGMSAVNYHLDAFYWGSGLTLVEDDEETLLKISPDFFGEKAIALFDKLMTWVTSEDVYCDESKAYEYSQNNGNALFMLNRLQLATNYLRNADFSYGVLPAPLYDESQENYISVVANPYTNYGIIADCVDPDRSGAVLEAWASAAYRTTTPALFEVTMNVKYSEDPVNAQMYDIIRSTAAFDLGRIFSESLDTAQDYYTQALIYEVPWTSMSASLEKQLPKMLEKLVDKLDDVG